MRHALISSVAVSLLIVSVAGAQHKPPASIAGLKTVTIDGLTWIGDLAAGLAEAAKEKKLVFIDFTGVSCTNCRVNEKAVFVKEEVKDLFKQYVRVQLYSDEIPKESYKQAPAADETREKDALVNQEFQKKAFKTEQLPLYVIVKPAKDGQFEVVGKYEEGRITKIDKFIEFLKKPLKGE